MQGERNEEDCSLPKATVENVIQGFVPEKYHITKDVRDCMRKAVHVFLNKLALDSNNVCEELKKKTISHDHVYKALANHGFEHFIEKCTEAVVSFESYVKKKPSRQNKFRESGLTMDELRESQMKLLDAAKNKTEANFGIENSEEE